MSQSDELDDILKELRSKSKKEEELEINSEPPADSEKDKFNPGLTIDETQKNKEIKNENTLSESVKMIDINNFDSVTKEEKEVPKKKNTKSGKGKKPLVIAIIAVLVIAIAVAAAFAIKGGKKEEVTEPTTNEQVMTEPVTEVQLSKSNPLTGSTDFNESAVGKRPIACVVENASAARPQWGIDDSKCPPDIIVEGEVEGGETRMLFMYADYTNVPSQIGPMRSARPPYIKFSELFDAIFLHWGQSQTKKGTAYIGANTVFRVDNVDHINQMTYGGKVALFGRDGSRGVSTEHTGVMYGSKIADAIKGEGFRTEANESNYTKFNFSQDEVKLANDCSSLALIFSKRTATRDWTFSDEDKMYHTSDFRTDVARKNLLVLFDSTEYISKANYKNSGSAEIYCNYKLSGGNGVLATNGTYVNINWTVDNGKLSIKDESGNDVSFNVGTTWIGYASSNNGGSVNAQ